MDEILDWNPESVETLVSIEEKSLPLEMRNADSAGHFSHVLRDSDKIVLLLRFGDKPVGFLIAMRYDKSYPELCNNDPNLDCSKEGFFYVDTILVNPRYYHDKSGLRLLVDKLEEKAKQRRFKGFCAYARTKNGLSGLLRKYFNGQKLRSIDNWLGFQETFDYLEVRF